MVGKDGQSIPLDPKKKVFFLCKRTRHPGAFFITDGVSWYVEVERKSVVVGGQWVRVNELRPDSRKPQMSTDVLELLQWAIPQFVAQLTK